ncbi:brain-specific angiogenesis inhibitor 1-associated protein 2-like protein 2 [Gadus macrocephalus]|uniref:brain-specific angiogenesis inhibitor 1-associated protein 2-like protein 2 n=1 Tax=Gadus macrocephalus TaxID=80720 RepID=UPI0028CB25E4|nr:brain-specific angiogenesis inhibitor 1-associated protein 2-like protein 2 [Gadus macrocephalus]
MSGTSDLLHKSTLSVYSNLMDQFNPGLQNLVTLGNSYVKAFQALGVCSEAYFSAVAKMGEQAMHTLSSRSLGDVLVQISETQRRLTAEMEGVFRWFQVEVLQAMEKKVKLDEEYMDGSRRVYELEVRNQAEALEKQLRRGTFRDSLVHTLSCNTHTNLQVHCSR